VASAVPLGLLHLSTGLPIPWTAYVGIGITAVFVEMTPDLDISKRQFGVIGELMGLKAYAKLVPHRAGLRKRHWTRLKIWHVLLFSHIPWLGTLIRTTLLLLPLGLLLLLFGWYLPQLPQMAIGLWIGMGWSDLWHTVVDVIMSDLKETKREFWGQRNYYHDREARAAFNNYRRRYTKARTK